MVSKLKLSLILLALAFLHSCKKEEIIIPTVHTSQIYSTNGVATKIKFIDSNIGFILSQDGKIHRTANGGSTWTEITVSSDTGMYFLSLNQTPTGRIFLSAYGDNKAYYSDDNGITWTSMSLFGTLGVEFSYFPTSSVGYVSYGSTLYKTTNGGSTWTYMSAYIGSFITDIFFIDANIGWMIDFDHDLYYTTNGGISWTTYYHSDDFISALRYYNTNLYFISGQGNIMASYDDGATISTLHYPGTTEDYVFNAIDVYGSTIFCVGKDAMVISKDGGSSFTAHFMDDGTSLREYILDVYLKSATSAIVVCESGKVFSVNL